MDQSKIGDSGYKELDHIIIMVCRGWRMHIVWILPNWKIEIGKRSQYFVITLSVISIERDRTILKNEPY